MALPSDPMVYLSAAGVVTSLVTALRLRRARLRARAATRRLAVATGHPSASGMDSSWVDRRELADSAAHHLAGLGLVARRRSAAPIVRARGAAGEYVLTVATGYRVIVEYETAGEVVELGEFPGIYGAVREIAAHADLPATV